MQAYILNLFLKKEILYEVKGHVKVSYVRFKAIFPQFIWKDA